MHILIIDDVQDTRQLFGMAFVLDGHRATTASSGAEAVEMMLKHRFDAVLLDIEMPYINGWQILEMIRSEPSGQAIPVIMFSAYHDMEKEARAEAAGAVMLLRKPMLPTHVVTIVEDAVSKTPAVAKG
jgi:CheY-like chemotaxis protein